MELIAIVVLICVVGVMGWNLGRERTARIEAETDAERWAKQLREQEARQDRAARAKGRP